MTTKRKNKRRTWRGEKMQKEQGFHKWLVMNSDWRKRRREIAAACEEFLAPGARVHVITDPPYGAMTHGGVMRGTTKSDGATRQALGFDHIEPDQIVPLLMDLATGWIVAFCELEALGDYKAAANDVHERGWVRAGVARRVTPQPQITGDKPGQGADGVAIMHAEYTGWKEWNGGGHAALWDLHTCRDKDRFHITQKPLKIMSELVDQFSNPGDVIIDPYGGAMTTGVAAIAKKRAFIGLELDNDYAAQGARRLRAAAEHRSIHEYEAGQVGMFL